MQYYLLIGLEIMILPFDLSYYFIGIISIPLVLVSRFLVLSLPLKWFKKKLELVPKTCLIMTWGGLRGGISVALALSLTSGESKDLILAVTYTIVVFSIIIQGLTLKPLIKRFM